MKRVERIRATGAPSSSSSSSSRSTRLGSPAWRSATFEMPCEMIADDVEARDALLLEQVGGVRVGLAEDRDQHVAAVDLVLAGRLHVRRGALEDALEAERLLRRTVVAVGQPLQLLVEVALELALRALDVAAAGADHLGDVVVVERALEHVLEAEELVPPAPRFADGEGRGWPRARGQIACSVLLHAAAQRETRAARASASTCATRVSATSRV